MYVFVLLLLYIGTQLRKMAKTVICPDTVGNWCVPSVFFGWLAARVDLLTPIRCQCYGWLAALADPIASALAHFLRFFGRMQIGVLHTEQSRS